MSPFTEGPAGEQQRADVRQGCLGSSGPLHLHPCSRWMVPGHPPKRTVESKAGEFGYTENLWSFCLCNCFCCLLEALTSPRPQKFSIHCYHHNLYTGCLLHPTGDAQEEGISPHLYVFSLKHNSQHITSARLIFVEWKKGMDELVSHFKSRSTSPSFMIRTSFKYPWYIMVKLDRRNKNDQP